MPTYISRITTHNQQELKISYKCDMLVVIIYGDLKMGGHTYCSLSDWFCMHQN